SRYSGHMIVYSTDIRYWNQRGEMVGQCRATAHEMADLVAVKSLGKNKDISLYQYTEAEVQKIEADKDAEQIGGNVQRYFEEVNEGDSIGHVVEGPWTMMHSMGYYHAAPNGSQGERIQRLWGKNTTRVTTIVDPRINAPVNAMLTHLDNDLAIAIGAP